MNTASFESCFRSKIPFSFGTKEYSAYEAMLPVLLRRMRMPHSIPNIVSLGDPEQDGDDQLADIVLCHLHSMGVLNYMGSIANHHPSDKRANFLRTQHFLLGTPEVLVAAGTDGTGGREHRALYYHELQNQTFDDQEWNKNDHIDGHRLLHQILNNTTTSNKVSILNTSSFQDLSEYFKTQDDQTLRERIGKVVSQGGYKIEYGLPQPDLTAMNNKFNPEAATYVTTRLGKLNIPSDAWGKQVAAAAALDRDFLKTLPGPLGYHIGWLADRKDYKYYFDALHQPFMPHLGKEWLLEIYMGIPRDSKEFQEILSQPLPFQTFLKAAKYPAYDACAAIGTLDPEILRCLGILEPSTGLGQVQTHRLDKGCTNIYVQESRGKDTDLKSPIFFANLQCQLRYFQAAVAIFEDGRRLQKGVKP
ncbi:unnamed protein product [Clonostachys rosea f. rosea IK726]|uniref:Uncharacterized protein n=1 Tax=Clonostachys rosea f. rosea IK726 TaxID=1349383 RepID=A0ACA9UL10_BIOOC|nr:unnamed protein product [Clonostachys rosea f. rosea IK726]